MDAREMRAFQEEVGAASLLTGAAGTGGIAYAVLEDADGTVLSGVDAPVGASSDGVIELERAVRITSGRTGRVRVGLSMHPVSAAARAGRVRTAAAALVMLALAGTVAGIVVARRRAELAQGETARARSLTDAVLDGIGDAVMVMDPQGILRLVNPAACRLFGRSAADLLGRSCAETPCGAVAGALVGDGSAHQFAAEGPEGKPLTIVGSSSPVRDDDGAVYGSAIVLRDVTELRRLRRGARMTESLAALGRLAAGVAHEVRNPLNAISVGVQRLEREFPPTEGTYEHRKLTAVLESEIKRLDEIVGRFLELARTPRVEPKPGDLDALALEMAALLAEGLPPEILLESALGGLPPVVYDAAAVRQVIHNLVRNAVEALGERGMIRIGTRVEGGEAILEISDDGPGIPRGDLERVFEFGFSSKSRGNGLGLPIVHRLVTEMNGTIQMDSMPDRGAVARVRLPLAAA